MNNIYTEIFSNTWQPTINLGDILKIPLVIILVGVLLYSFMLLLKVRILVDTINSEGNFKMKALVSINLFITIFATIIGTIIILLG
ncbi:MAG: DUF5657 family protein [Candidatus Dojkabacteria bacterium]|jgi:hypothetical protein|nr:DUF5657 family protein [Candidatus Dojkabacteria bacterium]